MGKFKSIGIYAKIASYKSGLVSTVEHRADINFSHETKISQINSFEKNLKSLVRAVCKAEEIGNTVEMYIVSSIYESSEGASLKSLDTNCWNLECADLSGIYLRPDTRYTEECWDLYIRANKVMDDIGAI